MSLFHFILFMFFENVVFSRFAFGFDMSFPELYSFSGVSRAFRRFCRICGGFVSVLGSSQDLSELSFPILTDFLWPS